MQYTVMVSQLVSPQWSVVSLQPVKSIITDSHKQKDDSAVSGKLFLAVS